MRVGVGVWPVWCCGSTGGRLVRSCSTAREAIGVLRASTSRRCCGRVRGRAVRGAGVLGWLAGGRARSARACARALVCGPVSWALWVALSC